MLQYRQLFVEQRLNNDEIVALCGIEPPTFVVAPHDYIEDEKSRAISHSQALAILTGDPDAFVVPSG